MLPLDEAGETVRQQAAWGRLSDQVAAGLQHEITSGGYLPGQRLPPEREMAVRFGVSRTVIREAMKSLSSRGVITVRPGSGVFVAQGQASAATESLRLLVLGTSALGYEQVYEVRESLEGRVAALAAERATEADMVLLHEAQEALDMAVTGEDYASADGDFHLVIADLAHNQLFRIVLEAIGDVMLEVRRRVAYVPAARARVTADHHAIAEAILARDAATARRLMEEHLAHSREIVREIDRSADRARNAVRRRRSAAGPQR
jgi:GntR family transcriptional repressor for pyruvate dehydrogenase complex